MENFNPRSPCGERLDQQQLQHNQHLFQSTLPVWGATHLTGRWKRHRYISIHAPRVGSDESIRGCPYARPISIHAPRVGSDAQLADSIVHTVISIHAPRVGSDSEGTGRMLQ